jgi:hypothetical protein
VKDFTRELTPGLEGCVAVPGCKTGMEAKAGTRKGGVLAGNFCAEYAAKMKGDFKMPS